MKSVCLTMLLAAGSLAAASADFAGNWKVKYTGPPMTGPKTIGSMIFTFRVDNGKVTGLAHIGSWPGLAPIADGKVDGERISFNATGHLPSTTGIPTCHFEGTLSDGELVIRLSTIRNPGGPGSGDEYEYRGGKLDAAAARAEKLSALITLSKAHTFSGYPQPDQPPVPGVDSSLRQRVAQLEANLAVWESVKPDSDHSHSDAFTDADLDDMIAFYNSPIGQSMIKAAQPASEIKTAVEQLIQ